jgi:hypothetical protein
VGGQRQQAEAKHRGTVEAGIRGPCSLWLLGFVMVERGDSSQEKIPQEQKTGCELTRVSLHQRPVRLSKVGG